MKNLLYVIVILFGSISMTQAQDYNSAVGLRLGYPLSVTYKKFLNENTAAEAFAGYSSIGTYSEFRVNAAYLIHNEFDDVERLKWYYGGGAGVAFLSYNAFHVGNRGGVGLALSGYLGLEYTLEDAPVSFSIDWVPTFFIGGIGAFRPGYGALAARYILD